jgi:hypothetical protein
MAAIARRTRPKRRSGPRGGSWIGALLLPLLTGCSGTPFGEALSRSFPAPVSPASEAIPPAAAPPAADPPSPTTTTTPTAPAAPANGTTPLPTGKAGSGNLPGSSATASASASKPGSAAARPPAPGTATAGATSPGGATGRRQGSPPSPAPGSSAAAPYRVTIRLPQADPSAPAEVVTEALRSAGVPFEVETIERVGVAAPAPTAAASTAAPQVRPAPPPR